MKVQIATSELIYNIRSKSASELSHVPAEQRYQWEVGTEKMDEVRRCIVESYAMLQETLSRFLRLEEDLGDIETDESILPELLVLDFENSGRRTAGRGQTLTDHCLAYLTDATLAKFYLSVSAMDMADKRTKMADAELNFITKLLYTKLPPRSIPTIVIPKELNLSETDWKEGYATVPGRVVLERPSNGAEPAASGAPDQPGTIPASNPTRETPVVPSQVVPAGSDTSQAPAPAAPDWEWEDTRRTEPEGQEESREVEEEVVKPDVKMMVCVHKDRILFSSDLGESYSAVGTVKDSPFMTAVVNSKPAGCDFNKDGRAVSSHIARAQVYPSFGGTAAPAFKHDTLFELEDGSKKKINTNATGNFNCFGSLIADSGRMAFFALVKFAGEDNATFRQLSTSASGWKVSSAWPRAAAGHICASYNFEVMACPGYISTDGGLTVRELTSPSSFKEVAVSGDGKVLYSVRKSGGGASILSISTDLGATWKNVLNLDEAAGVPATRVHIATNRDGSKVAVAVGNTFFAWSPDRGNTFETDTLGYEHSFNVLSMDASGYFVCVLNTTTDVISSYFGMEMSSRIYMKDMRTGETTVPNINNGITSLVSTVKLR